VNVPAVNDFYRGYQNLSGAVFLKDGGRFEFSGIESKKYLINSDVEKVYNDKGALVGTRPRSGSAVDVIQKALATVSGLGEAEVAAGRKRGAPEVDGSAFSRVGYGKGAPADMEHVLAVGLAYGRIKPSRDDLQRFADANFGVDCTGFACSFYRTRAGMPVGRFDVGCGTLFKEAIARYDVPTEAQYIRTGDALIWGQVVNGGFQEKTPAPGHISLIDAVVSRTADQVELSCRESNGEFGLTDPKEKTRTLGGRPASYMMGSWKAETFGIKTLYWQLVPSGEKVVIISPYTVT
jgi:hypothetical protein